MTKEEILAKSQKENKGNDPFEAETIKQASFYGYTFGWCLIILFNVLSLINKGKPDFSTLSIGTGMCFLLFLIKTIKMKKTHELFVTIFYGIAFAVSMFFYFKISLV